jgi:mRNA-degrading endonuclease YafQ of YafQ-DinJ toxin-antitoxin module
VDRRPAEPRFTFVLTPYFRRRATKLNADGQRALARALRLFELDSRDPRLDTHKLRGEHADTWAFAFGSDARAVFRWEGNRAVFLNVGSHDEVYG